MVLAEAYDRLSPELRVGIPSALVAWVMVFTPFRLWWFVVGCLFGYVGIYHSDRAEPAKVLTVLVILIYTLSLSPVFSFWNLFLTGVVGAAVIGGAIALAFVVDARSVPVIVIFAGGGPLLLALAFPWVAAMCVVSAVVWVVVGVMLFALLDRKEGFLNLSFWTAIGSGVLVTGAYPWVAMERIWAALFFLVLGGAGTLIAVKWQNQWEVVLAERRRLEEIEREKKRKILEEEREKERQRREQARLNRLLSLVDNPTEVNLNEEVELKHESLPILFEALGRCTSIQILRMRRRDLNDQDLLQLAHGLRSNSSLRVLDLMDNNKITQLGFTHLGSALKHSDNLLEKLILGAGVDTSPLTEIFRTNYTLTSVVHDVGKYRLFGMEFGDRREEESATLTPHLNRNRVSQRFIQRGLHGDGHLPPKLSLTLSTVALTDCQLTVIPPQLFDLSQLKILDLRYR